ncbi:SGNH/GDSL hydrolase family protein [Pediococcus siamensis]|uniref:SGNH/GDSL hydrolase family protein n=1 Tax=Pediococcus siamensis TaxID=381829 RepID=UPI0039A17C88
MLQTPCIIAISIDNGRYKKKTADGNCKVAEHLSQRTHTARIFVDAIRENDDLWRSGNGLAVECVIGEKVKPIRPSRKPVWFIGDSITAGIHVNGDKEPETNSYVESYTNVASNLLGLANVPIAYGATGITTAGSGGVPKASDYLNFDMAGVPDQCEQPEWVVLNYGTNDRKNRKVFLTEYRQYIYQLLDRVHSIPIIILKPFVGVYSKEIDILASEFPNVFPVNTSDWEASYTDDLHPDSYGSKLLGIELARVITDILNRKN